MIMVSIVYFLRHKPVFDNYVPGITFFKDVNVASDSLNMPCSLFYLKLS